MRIARLMTIALVLLSSYPATAALRPEQREELNRFCTHDTGDSLSDPVFTFCTWLHHGEQARKDAFEKIRDEVISGIIEDGLYGLRHPGQDFFRDLGQLSEARQRDALIEYYSRLESRLAWAPRDFDALLAHMRTAIEAQEGSASEKQTLESLLRPEIFQSISEYLRALPLQSWPADLNRIASICGVDGHGESAFSFQEDFEDGIPRRYGLAFCPGTLFKAGVEDPMTGAGFTRPKPRKVALTVFHELGHILGGHPRSRFYPRLRPFAACVATQLRTLFAPEYEASLSYETIADEWGIQALMALVRFEQQLKGDDAAAYELSRENLEIYCHGNVMDMTHLGMSQRLSGILAPKVCRYFKADTGGPADRCRLEL